MECFEPRALPDFISQHEGAPCLLRSSSPAHGVVLVHLVIHAADCDLCLPVFILMLRVSQTWPVGILSLCVLLTGAAYSEHIFLGFDMMI